MPTIVFSSLIFSKPTESFRKVESLCVRVSREDHCHVRANISVPLHPKYLLLALRRLEVCRAIQTELPSPADSFSLPRAFVRGGRFQTAHSYTPCNSLLKHHWIQAQRTQKSF